MKLQKEIEELENLQDAMNHSPISQNKVGEIIKTLKCVETVTKLFDYNVGKAFFHVEKIDGVPWLFFNGYQLIMLTDKQAKDIIKIYNWKE